MNEVSELEDGEFVDLIDEFGECHDYSYAPDCAAG